MPSHTFLTPLGQLTVVEQDDAITEICWSSIGDAQVTALLLESERQISAYFNHQLETFDLPLRPHGDVFQQSVNDQMRAIPFGQTVEYGQIAKTLSSMPQPVGNACGKNSIPIMIPCHRVVGAAGLGGFSAPGGVETKIALLKHEGAYGLLI